MILRFVIADDSQIPAVAESVEVADDGAFTGWRSVSDDGVGWFAGQLPPAEPAELRALVARAPEPGPMPPGPAREVLLLDGTDPISIAGRTDDLAAALRRLPDRLTDFPLAAVAVSFVGPAVARLSHRGTEPLLLDLDFLAVHADGWSGVADGPEEILVEPGWTYDVPLGIETATRLAVDFGIWAGTTRIPVRARATR